MKTTKFRILFFLVAGIPALLMTGCHSFGPGERTLSISFTMNEREEYPRSDQLVIWLEKADGTFFKTLFVSEYLSYGGFNDPDICPDWSSVANWMEASETEFDAVTAATPQVGPVLKEIVLSKEELPRGDYILFLEVHLTADYNELYSGKIRIPRRDATTPLEVSYRPERYHDATYNVLSDLRVHVQ